MNELKHITEKLLKFREERKWKKFHKPKDLALSLVLEASEVLEHFQWKSDVEAKKHIEKNRDELSQELADVFNWVLLMAHDFNVDIVNSSLKKIEINSKKYPIEKTKGKYTKYNKL